MKLFLSWLICKQGATGIEYGLLAGFVSIVIFGSVIAFGDSLASVMNTVATTVSSLVSRAG